MEEIPEVAIDVVHAQDRRDHLSYARSREGLELDDLRQARAPPPLEGGQQRVAAVQLVAAIGDEHERLQPHEPASKMVEKLTRRGVGPVDVLDHEDEPAICRRNREERDDRLEEPELRL